MDIPEPKTRQLIDSLARNGASFALCRKPWTDDPILVLQTSGQPAAAASLPAPSVSGVPAKEAAAFIDGCEGCPREYYAGAIGWLDPQGTAKLYVNLRCLHVTGGTLRLYTGGSVLPSTGLAEAQEETLLKLQTLTHIINNRI